MCTVLDTDSWIERLLRCEILTEYEMRVMCRKVSEILIEEENVVELNAPITICGDIHGQFFDLTEKLFPLGGEIATSRYLFLGDFVDRGNHSVETIALLLCYKIRFPANITLIRGNHESRNTTLTYGFYDEILQKYGNVNIWHIINDVFDLFPISAVVSEKIFAVHGGLSPDLPYIDSIRTLYRREEVPQIGPKCDLMWSDPEEIDGWAVNPRGSGWIFGESIVSEFCHLNEISIVVRSHQLAEEGYKIWFEDNFVTVWSAPNYCYRCGNKACILKFDDQLECSFEIFDRSKKSKASDGREVIPYFL